MYTYNYIMYNKVYNAVFDQLSTTQKTAGEESIDYCLGLITLTPTCSLFMFYTHTFWWKFH